MIAVVLISIVPLAFVVKLVKGVVPPTTPESVAVPAVLSVNAKAPLTVPPKVIFPVVFPEMIVSAVKTIGVLESPIDIDALLAVIVPLILTWLGAVAVRPPEIVVVPAIVTVPELEKVTPFVIVPPPLIAML